MSRIARIRIRWRDADLARRDAELPIPPAPVAVSGRRDPVSLNPLNWRIRIRWIGMGATSNIASAPVDSRQIYNFTFRQNRIRVSWLGWNAANRTRTWAAVLLILGLFVVLRVLALNDSNPVPLTIERSLQGLVTSDISLDGEIIRITHSPLDMGQPMDVFDLKIETLMRGMDANPFIMDFEFPTAKPIAGLTMDFAVMDFALRVKVYGDAADPPVLYQGEYRNLPPEPHVEIGFVEGPERVSRIYVEIEQLNPPDEPHIHVREVGFPK